MRKLWMAAAVVLLLPSGARADGFDDPKALVSALYEPYTHGQQPPNVRVCARAFGACLH